MSDHGSPYMLRGSGVALIPLTIAVPAWSSRSRNLSSDCKQVEARYIELLQWVRFGSALDSSPCSSHRAKKCR